MIQNKRQYTITQAQAAKFRKALAALEAKPGPLPAPLAKLERDAIKGQLATLEEELQQYENLENGNFELPINVSVIDLASVLVNARIAQKMTQAELAKKVSLHPQQIQQYEATGYRSANLERVGLVAEKLGVTVSPGVKILHLGVAASKRLQGTSTFRLMNAKKTQQLAKAKAAKKNVGKTVGPPPRFSGI